MFYSFGLSNTNCDICTALSRDTRTLTTSPRNSSGPQTRHHCSVSLTRLRLGVRKYNISDRLCHQLRAPDLSSPTKDARESRVDTRPGSNGIVKLTCLPWALMGLDTDASLPRCLVASSQGLSAEVWPAAGVYTAVLIGCVSSEAEAMTTPAYSEPSSHTRRANLPLFCPPHFSSTPLWCRPHQVTCSVTSDPFLSHQTPLGSVLSSLRIVVVSVRIKMMARCCAFIMIGNEIHWN